MKIYDKKPSKGFIHFLINLLLIILLFGALLYESWLGVGLVSVVYILYIWNSIRGFVKKSLPELFVRAKPILRIFHFLKNPLWIIVILLIVMNLLLWDISQRIGHDYKESSNGIKKENEAYKEVGITPPTGLYRTLYKAMDNIRIPYYDRELEEIIERLEWIDSKLGDIEWNTRW